MSTQQAPPRCNCRRHAVTYLRCSRCDTPICPDCSVVGPVGALCRSCGRNNSPLVQVGLGPLTLAYLACLSAGLLGGWILQQFGMGFGLFRLWGVYLYGVGIAEIALRITGRKRGTQMEILAGVCAAAGLLGGSVLTGLMLAFAHHLPLFFLFFNPMVYLEVGIAVFAAVRRIRYI